MLIMHDGVKQNQTWPQFGQSFGQKQNYRSNKPLVSIPMRIQGRLDGAEAATVLGFSEHDIPILVRHGLLKPLGSPVPNATKYFAACVIEEFAANPKWLNQATQVIYEYWKGKNDRKTANNQQADKSAHAIAIAA